MLLGNFIKHRLNKSMQETFNKSQSINQFCEKMFQPFNGNVSCLIGQVEEILSNILLKNKTGLDCSVKWTTDFTKVTQVRHLAKDEWEASDSIRFFIKMQNETE